MRRLAWLAVGPLALAACGQILGIDSWGGEGEGDVASSSTGGSNGASSSTATGTGGSQTTSTSGGGTAGGTAGASTATGATTGGGGSGGVGGGVGGADGCNDQMQDGLETGPDCGGPDCVPCQPGVGCMMPTDCASKNCSSGLCCYDQTISCSNSCMDGDETDVDCGGTCAVAGYPCAEGMLCNIDSDCDFGLVCIVICVQS